MIRHSVIFKLKCPKGSAREKEFLAAAAGLSEIPGVRNFESLRQISMKNDFEYGLAMEFDSKEAYKNYNQHPAHTEFVKNYWASYVHSFMEIDFEPISPIN